MAYVKRVKYVIKDNDAIKDELLELLIEEKGLSKNKASQLVFYSTPMSLIRWSNYLKPSEMEMYLVEFNEDADEDNLSDLGI